MSGPIRLGWSALDRSRDLPESVPGASPPPEEDLWFVAEDGVQTGPFPVSVVRERLRRGDLAMDALVWSEGMADWVPAQRVRLLVEPPPAPPAAGTPAVPPPPYAAPSGEVVAASPAASARAASRESTHAWTRFGARVVDLTLFQALAIGLLHAATGFAPDPFTANLWTVLVTVGLLGAWTPFEAWFLARYGATPGKWAFGLRVLHPDGSRLTFAEAWRRAAMVWALGLGLGLPVLQLILSALAWKDLSDTGTTVWDRRVGAVVRYERPGALQRVLVTLFFLFLFLTFLDALGQMSGAAGVSA